MRKFLLFSFLFFTLNFCYAQNTDSLKQDSVTNHVEVKTPYKNSYLDSMDQANMNRNLDNFLAMQKERERKQKQQMYIRIGIGVLFLVVLIVGMTRRRKQKNNAV